MNPILFHLWGPLSIHAYGTCIAAGIIVALWMLSKDRKIDALISPNDLSIALQLMVVSGYLGGRILCLASEKTEAKDLWLVLQFWEPGLSILGCIVGITLTMFLFLWIKKIPVLAFTDRLSVVAPLVQSFGRLGCFFAGCCYGQASSAWWAITYDHQEHMAPLHVPLHPTQLYSSIILFSIFLFLYFYLQRKAKLPGMVTCFYLMAISAERFVVDFWRWDRTWWESKTFSEFSTNQWCALGLFASALSGILIINAWSSSKMKR